MPAKLACWRFDAFVPSGQLNKAAKYRVPGGRAIKDQVSKCLHKFLLDLEEEEKRRRMQFLSDVGCASFGTIAAVCFVLLEMSEVIVLLTVCSSEYFHASVNYKKRL